MRKPEMTKNTSTPTKPPAGTPNTCAAMTASTATARRPWMSRRWCERGVEVIPTILRIDRSALGEGLRHPLHGDCLGGTEALGEETHAELLEQPARAYEALVGACGQRNLASGVGKGLLRPLELRHPRAV